MTNTQYIAKVFSGEEGKKLVWTGNDMLVHELKDISSPNHHWFRVEPMSASQISRLLIS